MAITVCYNDSMCGVNYLQLDERKTVEELYDEILWVESNTTFIEWFNPKDMNSDFIGRVNDIKGRYHKLTTLNKLSGKI